MTRHTSSGRLLWLLLALMLRRFDCTAANATTTNSTAFAVVDGAAATSLSPVIGILSQPLQPPPHNSTSSPCNSSKSSTRSSDDDSSCDSDGQQQQHYIAASYVKWLEVGGARSIPIPYDATNTTLLDELYGQINGLLLPGGAADLPFSVTYLLTKIVHANAIGHDYFPVWGTCLGFEFLITFIGDDGGGGASGASAKNRSSAIVARTATTTASPALQSGFDAENVSLPLEDVEPIGLYGDPVTLEAVTRHSITMNNHQQGIEPAHFLQNPSLTSFWTVTSTNHDRNGRPFVSTIEPVSDKTMPIYGVQYHPEKNAFEYATYPGTNIPYEAIDHSDIAVTFACRLARFFVNLTRKQSNQQHQQQHSYSDSVRFPLVGTYPTRTGIAYEQIYIIPNASHWETKEEKEEHPTMMLRQPSLGTLSSRSSSSSLLRPKRHISNSTMKIKERIQIDSSRS
jgi:gamma-glutamyl hydrolase